MVFVLRHLQDRIDALFFALVDEGAGVDHDRLGAVGFVDNLPALDPQNRQHVLGVDPIFRAAEADKVDTTIGDHGDSLATYLSERSGKTVPETTYPQPTAGWRRKRWTDCR